jgi:hypothetical protein
MNPDNFPPHIKQLFQNRDLTMNQKMVTLMAFMPDIPNMPPAENYDELGMTIKDLVENGKIRLDGFDKDFKLKVRQL